MSPHVVGIYTIGQTPRADLLETLPELQGLAHLEVRGVLDGLGIEDLPVFEGDGYPLETRMRDGTRVVLGAPFLEPRLQSAITALDPYVVAHLVLCAGPFPHLSAERPLVRPFEAGVRALRDRSCASLDVMVPFQAQTAPASEKWHTAGFTCRTHLLGKADEHSVERALELLRETGGDAMLIDYVGFPAEPLEALRAAGDLPVLDLGRLAVAEMARILASA
jgi:hypothetical protein